MAPLNVIRRLTRATNKHGHSGLDRVLLRQIISTTSGFGLYSKLVEVLQYNPFSIAVSVETVNCILLTLLIRKRLEKLVLSTGVGRGLPYYKSDRGDRLNF